MLLRLVIFMLCFSAAARAGEVRLSFADIPQYAAVHNQELAAASWKIREAQGRLLGAGRSSNPELGIEVKHSHEFNEGSITVSLDQKFPVTARLRFEKALSRKLVESAELEVLNAERKVVMEARTLAIRLLALDTQKALRRRQADLSASLAKFAGEHAKTGEISPLDAAQAQLDTQRLLLETRKLDLEKISLTGELKTLLGIAEGDSLVLIGALPAVSVPARTAWEGRPDYQQAIVNEQAAKHAIDLAKSKKWDDFSAGILAEGERMEDEPDGLTNTGFFGVRLTVPLPIWNQNQGEVVEKIAGAQRARRETVALAVTISNEAEAARSLMVANLQMLVETRDKLIPMSV
ncbi:MAG: TolC family protein, partial [Candidatus Methylacidiphilales bacterium]